VGWCLNQQDIIRMNNSSSMPFFKVIKTHCRIENYLSLNISWNKVQVIVQLRANMSQIQNIKLRSLENFYNRNINSKCICCTMSKDENLLHFMFECPRFGLIRSKFLSGYTNPQNEEEFLLLLSDPKYPFVNDIFSYTTNALRLRYLIIDP
jgi:hypothetical protein